MSYMSNLLNIQENKALIGFPIELFYVRLHSFYIIDSI